MSTESAGAVIGDRWEVLGTLGRGGFARTFLARDRDGGARVAIKMLDARHAEEWKAYQLFEREASVMRSLRHHGIPEVHASLKGRWESADAAFLVMEYIEGPSLAKMIEDKRHLEPADVLHIMVELLGILDYLHGRVPPILHRDIKPANIIVRPDGTPALVDFGAVRSVFRAPGESGSTVVGTYGYMPYEQYMGQATPASDLYALGATLLHLLTGRAPSEFMTDEGRLEVPDSLPGGERLRAVVNRLLRPSPVERFQSAREVRHALLGAEGPATPAAPGVALAVRPSGTVMPALSLPPVPRPFEGPTKELFRRVVPGAWRLMNASVKPGAGIDLWTILVVGFFSVITAGTLPMVFLSMANDWRRRLRPFFLHGLPAMAVVSDIELVDSAFGEKLARVRYEFEADGTLHRDADQVLPVSADRWRSGDKIQVLYLPDRGYDSVIIST